MTNYIDKANLVDPSVEDGTVQVADLANGTPGQLITWASSGSVGTVGTGTSGQVLTSAGAGLPPAFSAIPAATESIAGVAEIATQAEVDAITDNTRMITALKLGKSATVLHKNIDGEINSVTTKATPVNADVLLIEDSAATFAKKKATLTSLPFINKTGHTAYKMFAANASGQLVQQSKIQFRTDLAGHAGEGVLAWGETIQHTLNLDGTVRACQAQCSSERDNLGYCLQTTSNLESVPSTFIGARKGGDLASPVAVPNNYMVVELSGATWDATAFRTGGRIMLSTTENQAVGAHGCEWVFSTVRNGTTTLFDAMKINNGGFMAYFTPPVIPTTANADSFRMFSDDSPSGDGFACPNFVTEDDVLIQLFQGAALTAPETTLTNAGAGGDSAIQAMTAVAPFGFVTAAEGEQVVETVLNNQARIAELEARLQAHGLLA